MGFCSKIRSEMFSDSWTIKLNNWGSRRYRIGVEILEESLDVIDCFISCIQNICVRCRNVDEVIESNDWFHIILYTRVLLNTTKWMKNHQFCGAHLSINFCILKPNPLHPASIAKCSGLFNLI